MNANFTDENEKIYRAVLPVSMYWKNNGTVSSAAFKDKNGLSTDRAGGRITKECVLFMRSRRRGAVVSVTVKMCNEVNAILKFLPIKDEDEYHSEIHKSQETILLTDKQAKYLAHNAKIEYNPAI